MPDIAHIAAQLGNASRSGKGWKCLCPAHNDHNPSLSLSESEDGQTLVHCHAGCTQSAVIDALKDRSLWSVEHGLQPDQQRKGRIKQKTVPVSPVPAGTPKPSLDDSRLGTPSHCWEYKDASGQTLGFVRRFETANGKTFRPLTYWREVDGEFGWRSAGFAKPLPIYGLDRLADRVDEPVIVTEGEKAADAAAKLFPRYVAIAWPNGAKSAGSVDWSPLAERVVYIWPDADQEGQRAALEVARQCLKHGAESIRIFQIPGTLR